MTGDEGLADRIKAGVKAWGNVVRRTTHVHDVEGGFIGEPQYVDSGPKPIWYRLAKCSCGEKHNHIIDPPEGEK